MNGVYKEFTRNFTRNFTMNDHNTEFHKSNFSTILIKGKTKPNLNNPTQHKTNFKSLVKSNINVSFNSSSFFHGKKLIIDTHFPW
ncbi:hypothetical protein PIROE2DRAFT_19026 [Piromyces sp. E2]|nr:hypothetical protein PIROE2DRAFT_19026 [Piromyces sp. E2]|eukprot:OUM56383.1 hypothetical protein PIROE2DRAFT_19026 [Piromyces sp. E2]